MSKSTGIYIFIAALLVGSLACQLSANIPFQSVRGSGNVVTEDRQVGDFSRIDLSGIGDLEIELGDQPALRIEAEDNIMPLIETEVVGDTLRIGLRNDTTVSPREPIRYFLTVVSLEALDASGLGSITTPGLQAERFTISISGGGDIELASLEADTVEVDISGLGSLKINGGETGNLEVSISGGGGLGTENMQAQEADINISGLGSATVRVSDHLRADISGGGSIKYYGDPTIDENVSGLGNVERLGD
jgi:Putative auto-transporter adhesin, head GIN domain